jgi:hypothetical protein
MIIMDTSTHVSQIWVRCDLFVAPILWLVAWLVALRTRSFLVVLSTKSADPASQATGRQKKVVKELEWRTRPRVTTLTFPRCRPLGRAPHLHTILKHWADDRINDSQFRSDTETQRQQYRAPRVESSQTLPICSGYVCVPAPGGGQPNA